MTDQTIAAADAAHDAARAAYAALVLANTEANLAAAAMLMDTDIREAIHDDCRASDAAWFLAEYCTRHKAQFGEEFSWA